MQFAQVKMTVRDPEVISSFYQSVVGSDLLLPTTELDETAARAIGASGHVVSITLLGLPGDSRDGPDLELISFRDGPPFDWPYRSGQGLIAFKVDDVEWAVARLLKHGGSLFGEVVDWTAPSGRRSRFVFARDPEGNIVDLYGPADD